MLKNFQGDSWASILPLRMSSLLPHDLCHGRSSWRWLPESACNVGDPGSIPGSRRSPGKGNGNPLLFSYLENPVDGGACLNCKELDTTEWLHTTTSWSFDSKIAWICGGPRQWVFMILPTSLTCQGERTDPPAVSMKFWVTCACVRAKSL